MEGCSGPPKVTQLAGGAARCQSQHTVLSKTSDHTEDAQICTSRLELSSGFSDVIDAKRCRLLHSLPVF